MYTGGSEDTPESLSRQRIEAMLSDGRAADVGFDRVREENRCKEGNIALFAVDSRRARGQTDVRKYPWDSVDREIGV